MRRAFAAIAPLLAIVVAAHLVIDAGPARAQGGPFVVDSTLDQIDADLNDGVCRTAANTCTLRAAVMQANVATQPMTIQVPAGTFTLTLSEFEDDNMQPGSGDLDVRKTMAIQGVSPGETIIDGNGTDRVFDIDSSDVQISRLTIRNGRANTTPFVTARGGGVRTRSSVTLTDVIVKENQATQGAGVAVLGGTLSLVRSTLTANSASGIGGGLYFDGSTSPATVRNSTISGNAAAMTGGGIANRTPQGSSTAGPWFINATIVGNTAPQGGTAIDSRMSPIHLNSTVIDGSCIDVSTTEGYNLRPSGNCHGLDAITDRVTTDTKLGPLQLNSGSTPTHALLSGSPALDGADPVYCGGQDQRGSPRPKDGNGDGTVACDIGAYEAPGIASIRAAVTLQGRSASSPSASGSGTGHSMVRVTFDPAGLNISATADSDGNVLLPALPTGTYDVEAQAPGYITRHKLVNLADEPILLDPTRLAAGLVNSDNIVDINDITTLITAFGIRPTGRIDGHGNIVDINNDGVVSLHDITLTLSNFGALSPAPW